MDANIRIYETTKNRLDVFKGRKSYNDLLEEMLSYFEITGVAPTSRIASPVVTMKEQSNRVIEVMRGVEKKQNVALNSIYELLKTVSLGTHNNEKGEPISPNDENYLHINEVKDLIEKHKILEESYRKTEAKNRSLLQQVEELKSNPNLTNSTDLVNTNVLLEIIETIDSSKKTATFNNAIYEIDRNIFDAWIGRLTKELKK